MKKLIDRLFLGFHDNDVLAQIEERFIPWSQMLYRLILEKYAGKKMKYIVIFQKTQKIYDLYKTKEDDTYYHRGNLTYNGLFDLEYYNSLSPRDQIRFVWDKSCEYLIRAAEKSDNIALADACRYAHAKGLEMDLNPNICDLSISVGLYGELLNASVWMYYEDHPEMITRAVFILKKNDKILMELEFCKLNGFYEFFPEWIKKIEVKNGNMIIIKGHYELECLPFKIPISEELVRGY